jgi:hypothetical protein
MMMSLLGSAVTIRGGLQLESKGLAGSTMRMDGLYSAHSGGSTVRMEGVYCEDRGVSTVKRGQRTGKLLVNPHCRDDSIFTVETPTILTVETTQSLQKRSLSLLPLSLSSVPLSLPPTSLSLFSPFSSRPLFLEPAGWSSKEA